MRNIFKRKRYFFISYMAENNWIGNSFWIDYKYPNNKEVREFLSKTNPIQNVVIINIIEITKKDYLQFTK